MNLAVDQNDGWNKFYHSGILREISWYKLSYVLNSAAVQSNSMLGTDESCENALGWQNNN